MRLYDNVLKSLAIFMSCLIISIPFYISNVYAATGTVNIVSVKGKDGIEGVRASDDKTAIIADVLSGAAVNPADVHMIYMGQPTYESFSACALNIDSYTCNYNSSISKKNAGSYTVKVCVAGCCAANCNTCSETRCASTKSLYIDGIPPLIRSFDIEPRNTSGTDLNLSYDVEDRICTHDICKNKCSGINRIEVIANGSSIVSSLNVSTRDCTKSAQSAFSAAVLPNGRNRLCIKVYDMVGQANNATTATCIDVNKDSTVPVITVADIFDLNGIKPLRYTKPSGTNAKFIVNLTSSPYFGIKNATVDLSGFNLGVLELSCRQITGGLYQCEKNITLLLPSQTAANAVSEVENAGGLKATRTTTIDMQSDSTAPVVEAVITDHSFNNTGFIGRLPTNITAIINDTGAGLAGSDVTITIGTADPQRAICYDVSGKWHCTISNVTATADLAVTVKGKDDAGNEFTPFNKLIKYDSYGPQIMNVTLRNIANQNAPYFVVGDDLLVRALFSDDSGLKDDSGVFDAYAYFQGFATAGWVKAMDCYYANSTDAAGKTLWKCEWNVMDVHDGKISMRLNASDIVGNRNDSDALRNITEFYIEYLNPSTGGFDTIEVPDPEVYYQDTNATPDFWNVSVIGVSPTRVNSKTAAIFAHDIWFNLDLKTNYDNVYIANLMIESCHEISNTSTDYASYFDPARTTLVRPTLNSTQPWLRAGLKRGSIAKAQLSFQCTLNTVTLRGKNVSQIEKDNVTLTIGVITDKDIGDSVDDEIDSVKEGWLAQAKWISTLAKVFDLVNQFCNILYVLESLFSALGLVEGAASWADGTPFQTIANVAGKAADVGDSTMRKGIAKLYQFCDYATCRTSYCGEGNKGNGKWYCTAYKADWSSMTNKLEETKFGNSLTGLAKLDFISGVQPQCKEPHIGRYDDTCEKPDLSNIVGGDPKSGLWGSVRTLCIPGIINSLNNMREIECQYLYCLNKEVPAGIPIYACTSVRSYSWCMFVWGEIFQVLPFASFLKGTLQTFKSMFENPEALLMGFGFKYLCANPSHWAEATCRIIQAVSSGMELKDIFDQMKDQKNLFDFKTDVCDEALKK